MGYENKLIIVDVYDSVKNDSGKNWAEVTALLNMCKAGLPVSKFLMEITTCPQICTESSSRSA